MKKVLLGLVTLMTLCVSGCSGFNKQILDFQFNFTKVHVLETNKCYTIETWTDYEDGEQIQVKIKDKGYCLFHSNQIVLIEDKCPFCD